MILVINQYQFCDLKWTKMKKSFLLYGAYGYTGELISRFASQYDLIPILAGRDEVKLKKLSEETGYEYVAFSLDDEEAMIAAMEGHSVFMHCAGPFIYTYEKVAAACLKTGTHYLDITGEIGVFESLSKMDNEAREKGIMLLPGVGFDIVPSDCMAMYLKSLMPDANQLSMSIKFGGGISRGTQNTAVGSLGSGGMIRKEGKLLPVKSAYRVRKIDFGNGPETSVTIPWGDVSTAYHSTGIPNVMVYVTNAPVPVEFMKLTNYLGWLLDSKTVQKFMKKRIQKGPAGPTDAMREKGESLVWGEVINPGGDLIQAVFKGPEGYTLTAKTALMAIKKILNGEFKAGFQTPGTAFGMDFILELEGTNRKVIKE